MLIATAALIIFILAHAIISVFFPEKPDEPPLFTINIENESGVDILGFGITYSLANGEIFEIPFYESLYGSADPSGFVFSFDVNTAGDNFFSALADYSLSAENGKSYDFLLEKTAEGFSLSQK